MESDRDVYTYPPSSTYFSKGSRQTPLKIEGTVSVESRTITNLHFADAIDGLAGEEDLAKLVERLDKASTADGMEISAKKTKLMTNNTSVVQHKN